MQWNYELIVTISGDSSEICNVYSIDSLLVLKTTRVTRHQFAPARSWCDIDTVWLTQLHARSSILFNFQVHQTITWVHNALVANADELQTQLWTIQFTSGNSISWAIGTVLTQYCVSEWIWTSRAKEHHGSPILVVSLVLLWALYSLLFNYQYRQQVLGLTDISRST